MSVSPSMAAVAAQLPSSLDSQDGSGSGGHSHASSSFVLSSGRRGSTGVVAGSSFGSNAGSAGAGSGSGQSMTPGAYTRRVGSGSGLGTGTGMVHRERYAPTLNACRCLNMTFSVSPSPPLSDGEIAAVESLFGPADPSATYGFSGAVMQAQQLFPDGYFCGRLLHRSVQQEGLVHTRPHPVQNQFAIKRCLNCHLDAYAVSAQHQLLVASAKTYHGEEIRKWKETDAYSKYFNLLIRGGGGGSGVGGVASSLVAAGSSPGTELMSSFSPTSPLGGALQQLRLSLDQCLEVERISLEARLSQLRAVEEAKFAEVETRMRRELAALVANVEREQESGPCAAPPMQLQGAGEGVSPRHAFDPFARRNSTARSLHHHKKSSVEALALQQQLELAAAAGADDTAEVQGSTSGDRSLTPTRVMDMMASSRGLSPSGSTGIPGLSRTNSRGSGSRDSHTPPMGTSVDERASAAAAAALHKSAASVVALPLDLRQAAPTTPLQPVGAGPTAAAPPSAQKRNLEHLPAPPVLAAGAPPSASSTAPGSPGTAPAPTAAAAPKKKEDDDESDAARAGQSAAASAAAAAADGLDLGDVALVPFDEESSPQGAGLLTSLSNFDEFVLPASSAGSGGGAGLGGLGGLSGSGRSRSGEDDAGGAIFALDEEQHSPTAEGPDSGQASPQLRATAGGELDDELDEEEEEEDAEDELSDEDLRQKPVSGKAAKLLGMDGGGRASASSLSANNGGAGAAPVTPHIIRPRTVSGSRGVTMVPMSMPIAIPTQLRAMADGPAGGAAGAAGAGAGAAHPAAAVRATPVQQSGLGRSLQARGQVGGSGTKLPPAPSVYSSESGSSVSDSDLSDGDDSGRRRGRRGGDDGAFVPPHTLVEEPYFSFAKVRHLASFKDPSPAPSHQSARSPRTGGSAAASASPLPLPTTPAPAPAILSSSVPRVVGSLGAPQMVRAPAWGEGASDSQAQSPTPLGSKLGFNAVTAPPSKSSGGQSSRGMPSSRNPTQQQQQQQAR